MNSNLSLELLSDLKSSYVLFSPLKSAKISLESIFSLLFSIRKASVPLTLTTQRCYGKARERFDYPILLHCSQTQESYVLQSICLITLFFYTALKLNNIFRYKILRLITLFFYTALKLLCSKCRSRSSLITLFFYTALKPWSISVSVLSSLITLFFYTALKRNPKTGKYDLV